MKRTLEYRLARTRNNTPLVTLDSPLGNGQELEPAGLRALAAALLRIAGEAEGQDVQAEHYRETKRAIELEWTTTA
jgi:hypothetical protein